MTYYQYEKNQRDSCNINCYLIPDIYNQYIFQVMKALQIDQSLNEVKQKKQIVFQDSSHNNNEKLTIGLQDSSYSENKQENSNANIQINSLAIIQINDNIKNTSQTLDILPTSHQLLTISDDKNQVEGKNKKKKKLLNNETIFQSYYLFLKQFTKPKQRDYFREYSQRRNYNFLFCPAIKIDLGVYNLREVVDICVTKKIISNSVMMNFVSGPEIYNEEKFVAQLNNKQFQNLGIEKKYFTPFDHRLLCMLLTGHFPNEFQFPKNPIMQSSILTVFYSFLYQLSQQKYEEIFQFLGIKYNRDWLPSNFNLFVEQAGAKIARKPDLYVEQSYPLHMPARKLRKKINDKI